MSGLTQQLEFECPESGERLDRVIAEQLQEHSRSAIQRWIRSGDVTVNGQSARPSYHVLAGDVVRVRLPDSRPMAIEPREMALTVVHEDQDCVVIDKPPGLVVHPATSHRQDTLVNALLARYPAMADMIDSARKDDRRPGIVHRLDRDTSGLIVVARHEDARAELQRQFRAREVEKVYLALVYGRVSEPEGRISAPIGRDPRSRQRMAVVQEGRDAITRYVTRQYLFTPHGSREHYTLAEVYLLTGRTHQIRVHFAHIGHPVVGDRVYGRRKKRLACPRQFLHAWRLGFHRPSDGKWMCFEAPLPADLAQVLSQLQPVV